LWLVLSFFLCSSVAGSLVFSAFFCGSSSVGCCGLERKPNRRLHDPWIARGRRLAKVGVDLLARRVELRCGIDRRPVHLVEHVVHLPPELNPLAAANREV